MLVGAIDLISQWWQTPLVVKVLGSTPAPPILSDWCSSNMARCQRVAVGAVPTSDVSEYI